MLQSGSDRFFFIIISDSLRGVNGAMETNGAVDKKFIKQNAPEDITKGGTSAAEALALPEEQRQPLRGVRPAGLSNKGFGA